jgi:hypothetical protein
MLRPNSASYLIDLLRGRPITLPDTCVQTVAEKSISEIPFSLLRVLPPRSTVSSPERTSNGFFLKIQAQTHSPGSTSQNLEPLQP